VTAPEAARDPARAGPRAWSALRTIRFVGVTAQL
jgi:hypothetical protein